MKRILSLLLCVTVLFGIIPIVDAQAETDTTTVEAEKSELQNGDTFFLGSYPQNHITDTNLITVLNSIPGTWLSYNYYNSDWEIEDYMMYKDVVYNGNKYRAVLFSKGRPWHPGISHPSSMSIYACNQVHWFSWDPLKWILLDSSSGLAISEKVLDAQFYHHTSAYNNGAYGNNYEKSDIRAWLNNNFYNAAFTWNDKLAINLTINDNTADAYQYSAANTEDYVFLLSKNEYTWLSDSHKNPSGTKYSIIQGLPCDSNGIAMHWLLRTAGSIRYRVYYEKYGSLDRNDADDIVMNCGMGIRPAIYLDLENYQEKRTYESLEQYVADVILCNGYQGCLSNYHGNTPQNFSYHYLMDPKQVSLSRVYVDLLYQNKEFQNSLLGWEITTFSPSDVIYQNALDEVGYYEAVIMSTLNCAVKYSLIPDAIKETAKASTGITKGVYKVLNQFADMDYEELSSQPWSLFDTEAQHKAIQEAASKCTSLRMRSMSVSEFSDIMSQVGTIKEFCEKVAQFEQVAKLDESVGTVLDYLYQACPDSNPTMKAAIAEVRTVCKSGLDKFAVDVYNGTIAISKMSADQLVDTAWKSYVIAELGASIGSGVLIGQLIGQSLSNFLFSTDNVIEQYYAMRALVQFESVMVDATANIAAQYISEDSASNATTFLTAIKMLIGTYDVSCDYAEEYTKIVKTEGLINELKSLFGFGNKQDFEAFKSTCQLMKGSLSTFEMCLTDVEFAYTSALQIDDNELYQTYISSGTGENSTYWKSKLITVACPTDVDVYQGDVKVAQTASNELVGLVPGIAVYIDNDVKHIVLPAEGDYSVQITGTDTGTMDYVVGEYNSGRYNRGVTFENVPLTANCTYNSAIVENCYEDIVLIDDNNEIILPSYDSATIEPISMFLSLGGDLTMHFSVTVGDSYISDGHMQITVGNTEPVLQKISDAQTDENGNYIFTVDVKAAQMMDDISLQLIMDDQVSEVATYSIHEYAIKILQDESYSEYHALVKEMLNYGTAAQVYFDYNTENLANDGITDVTATVVPETAENMTVNDKISGLNFYGASLVYRDRIAVRYYFTGNVTSYTFTANGNTYTPIAKDGMYYVEIPDILPQNLDQQITLSVADTEGNSMSVTYGPMNYIVRMYHGEGSDSLKDLLRALYVYHKAAKEYTVGNKENDNVYEGDRD